MDDSSSIRVQRRIELYGPNRCLARQAAKEKLIEDHVKKNLQNAADQVHSNHTFQTTTAKDFEHKQPQPFHRVKPKNTTYVYFGSETQPSNSVTKSDFPGIFSPQYNRRIPDGLGVNNFADFAPRYRLENSIGRSFYKADFDREKSFTVRQASTADNSKFHTSTHFQLGSHSNSFASEANLSFRGDGDFANPDTTASQEAMNCSKSSVFRPGDYNMTMPNTEEDFISTQKKDYAGVSPDSLPVSEETDGEDGHRGGTNFILGYDEGTTASVYNQDFNPSRLKGVERAPLASDLPCSKVMHEFPVFSSSTSVNSQDYVKLTLGSGRFNSLRKIQERHKINSVNLNRGIRTDDHLRSVTAKTFSSPQCTDYVKPVIPKQKDYHHLESNRALPHPVHLQNTSEAQESYSLPIETEEEYTTKKRECLSDRKSRIQDNKATHFIVGSDPLQRETEQTVQFCEKPLDSMLMAAGRPDLPTKGYPTIAHEYYGEGSIHAARGPGDLQQLLQQRNYLKNINPRDTVNLNLRKAFLEYDKNLTGAISKDDLKLVCKDMEVAVSESDLDEIITRCDLKGDGLIDYNEFALNLSRLQPPSEALLYTGEPSTTITQEDFKHPKDQQMSAEQQLAMEKDSKRFEPVETQPSRLFQWAAQKGVMFEP